MHGGGRCLCVLLAVLPTAGAAQGFGDLAVLRAMDALQRGDDAQALMALTPIADRTERPTSPCDELCMQARFLAAQASANLGLHESALLYLDQVDKAFPEVEDFILAQRARTLRAQGNWAAAQATWQLLLQRCPTSPLAAEAAFGVADAHYAADRTDLAFAAYEEAQRAWPKSERAVLAQYNLGRIEEGRGNNAAAAAWYQKILAGRGASLLGTEATLRLEALTPRMAGEPVGVKERLRALDRLLKARALDEAQAALENLASSKLDAAERNELEARRALLAYRRGNLDIAIELYERLAKGAVGRSRLEYARPLAAAYAAANRYQDAIAVHRDIAAHYRNGRDGREAAFRAAWLAHDAGDHAQAMRLFHDFLATYPRDRLAEEAAWYIGWNAYRMGDKPAALQALGRLRQLFRRSSLVERTWYWEGRIQADLGNVAAARSAYDVVAARPTTYYGMMARARLSDLEGGSTRASPMVAELDPPSPIASDAVAATPSALPLRVALGGERKDDGDWGADAFDFSGPAGKRALRLIRLGMRREAARLVAILPTVPGTPRDTVAFSRARLLHTLGDFSAAYRLVNANFRSALEGAPAGKTRRYFEIAYPDAHADLVRAAAQEFGISPLLVLAIMRQESAFDDQADSWASARGLMQIIPVTGRRIAEVLRLEAYNDGVLREPVVNVRFGTWYLAQLLSKFDGNVILGIGSYNAGPQAMGRWVDEHAGCDTDVFIEEIPFRETRHYVKSVLANLAVYAQLYANTTYRAPPTVTATYGDNVDF